LKGKINLNFQTYLFGCKVHLKCLNQPKRNISTNKNIQGNWVGDKEIMLQRPKPTGELG